MDAAEMVASGSTEIELNVVSLIEQLRETEYEKDTVYILFRNFAQDIDNKFRTYLDRRSDDAELRDLFDQRTSELCAVREQLRALIRLFLRPESSPFQGKEVSEMPKLRYRPSQRLPYGELGPILPLKIEDSPRAIFKDSSRLKSMSRDQMIDYFRKQMDNMKQRHDKDVEYLTEMIFDLKRELHREIHNINESKYSREDCRIDKEFDQLRYRASDIIAKLDNILSVYDGYRPPVKEDNCSEDHYVLDYVFEEQKDLEFIMSRTCHDSSLAPLEAKYMLHLRKVNLGTKHSHIEAITQDKNEMTVSRELVGKFHAEMHALEVESKRRQDSCSIIYNEPISDVVSSFEHDVKKSSIGYVEMLEIERLKQNLESLKQIEKENEALQLETKSRILVLSEQINNVCQKVDALKEIILKHEFILAKQNQEFDLISARLEEVLLDSHFSGTKLSELSCKYKELSEYLKISENNRKILCAVIEEKEKAIIIASAEEDKHHMGMTHMHAFVESFITCAVDRLSLIENRLDNYEARVDSMMNQFNSITNQVCLLKGRMLRYKDISDTRGSNLQKAETEVDLLGDEVEALTKLLRKIHMALDHYAPVLKHYTGVMEILKVIKKELGDR